jgi:hypothetical protein
VFALLAAAPLSLAVLSGLGDIGRVRPAHAQTSTGGTSTTTLRFGTLAPKNSWWGKVLVTWEKALDQRTNGRLQMNVLWNGTAGPGATMLGKLKTGTLDGAGLGLDALAGIYPDIWAVDLPGVARKWGDLAIARDTIQPDLEAALTGVGLRFYGWSDLGDVRLATDGFAAQRPADLAGRHAMVSRFISSPVAMEILSIGGAIVNGGPPPPVPTSAPRYGPMYTPAASPSAGASGPPQALHGQQLLGKPRDDMTLAPALSLGQMSSFDHMDERVVWYGTAGATVFARKSIAALPSDLVQIFDDVARAANRALAVIVSKEDAAATGRLAATMTLVRHTPSETGDWDRFFFGVAKRIAGTTVSKKKVNQVLSARRQPTVP